METLFQKPKNKKWPQQEGQPSASHAPWDLCCGAFPRPAGRLLGLRRPKAMWHWQGSGPRCEGAAPPRTPRFLGKRPHGRISGLTQSAMGDLVLLGLSGNALRVSRSPQGPPASQPLWCSVGPLDPELPFGELLSSRARGACALPRSPFSADATTPLPSQGEAASGPRQRDRHHRCAGLPHLPGEWVWCVPCVP